MIKATYLDDLPPAREFISKFLLHTRDSSNIRALLDLIIRADGDLTRLRISKHENFLGRELYEEHGDVVLQDLAIRHLHK